MPLSTNPHNIIHPDDRWIPSNSLSEKELMQVLPPLVKKLDQKYTIGDRKIIQVLVKQQNI